jgi:hypothetical protein
MADKRTTPEDLDDTGDGQIELSQADLDRETGSQFDAALSEWIEKENFTNDESIATLYKHDNPKGGREKVQVWEWHNEIPSAHSIGLQFGSGRYTILFKIPKKKAIRGYTFRLSEYYDEMRRAQNSPVSQLPGAMPPYYPVTGGKTHATENNGLEASLNVIERIFSGMVMPMMARINQPAVAPAQLPDFSGMAMQNYQNMMTLAKTNALEMARMGRMLTDKTINDSIAGETDDMDTQDDPSRPPTILEQIMPLVNQFLPMLLNNNPAASAAVNVVKQMPQYKELAANPAQLAEVVNYLDKSKGKAATTKILKKLNIPRPGESRTNAAVTAGDVRTTA